MKPKSYLILTAGLLALAAAARAATVTYVGSVEGVQVTEWRTTTTVKSLDIDGDNQYGTYGAVTWTVGSTGEQPLTSSNPGWAYGAGVSYGEFINGAYADIDHVTSPGNNSDTGIYAVQWGGTFIFEMTGNASTYTGMTVRVGFMADVLSPAEWAADNSKTFRLLQTTGGSGDSGTISLRGGSAGNGVPEMYFFDISGLTAGNRFQIVTDAPGNGGQPGYIGSVSWDVVPEPSAALLGGVGLLGLLRRRR
ncbi:MAG: hypothetical protein J0M04_11030 [Verrucomicrobia bacterium]|nr:hypothetical protein [Verrucomicrobiota bacterium]